MPMSEMSRCPRHSQLPSKICLIDAVRYFGGQTVNHTGGRNVQLPL
jgi:hypothetical protein